MTRYLLSVHTASGEPGAPVSEEEMRRSYERLGVLEKEMASAGAWVFSGKLHDAATVVRVTDGRVLTTDGPFVEAREHLGGFYGIEVEDLDAALGWASKVTAIIGAPIEVRPFAGFATEPGA